LVVLVLVFVSRGDALSALWGLGAVWIVFLVFVAVKFAQAFAHPDLHRGWEWVDYSIGQDSWRLEVRSFAPLRPRPLLEQIKPLRCRVIAPDGCRWESSSSSTGAATVTDPHGRFYPEDFTCPKCGQQPPQILAGEYEITWLQPAWGPFRRPMLRYTQRTPERVQAPEPGERES
jgi:hypothetical protein